MQLDFASMLLMIPDLDCFLSLSHSQISVKVESIQQVGNRREATVTSCFLLGRFLFHPLSFTITTMSLIKHALIIGGKGALGTALIEHFKRLGFGVASVDRSINIIADFSIVIPEDCESPDSLIRDIINKDHPDLVFSVIVSVAGGWLGGNCAEPGFLKTCRTMWTQCVESSLVAASIAATHLMPGSGLLILTGAKAALEGTPEMIGYGIAKAAVHQLTRSLAGKGSGLPSGARVIALLPLMLDTPINRKANPTADTGSWTPLEYVSSLLSAWTTGTGEGSVSVPESGSLVCLITKNGETKIDIK